VVGGLLYQHCINNNGQTKEGRREEVLEGLYGAWNKSWKKWPQGQQLREERQEVALGYGHGLATLPGVIRGLVRAVGWCPQLESPRTSVDRQWIR